MTRDLRLDVNGDSSGGQKALEEAALAAEAAAKAANHLGDEFRKASRDASELDKKLLETKVAAAALAKEFARTNDSGIKKELDAQRSAASELQKLRKDIVGSTEKDAKAAEAAWSKAAAGVERAAKKAASEAEKAAKQAEAATLSLGDFAPSLGPVGIGVGAALAVPALAGAGGAITAGAGLGAIGAGVAGAVAGDPGRFQAEWAAAIEQVSKNWQGASKSFTEPTLAAIRSIGPLFDGLHIDKTLATAASYVRPLVAGVEGFVVNIEGGVDKLVQKAGPVFTELEATLPDFGAMIADGLGAIADNAQGGAQALGDIIQLVGGVTDGLLHVVAGAEAVYGEFKKLDVQAADFIRHHQTSLGILTGGLSGFALQASDAFNADEVDHYGAALDGVALTGSLAADSTAALAAAAAAEKTALDGANRALDTAINNALGLSNANVGAAQAFADLASEYKKGAGALDINTQKGRDNQTLIDSTIASLERQRDASIAAGDGSTAASAAASKAYNDQLTKLQQVIDKANGGKSSIDAFIDSFRDKTFTITQKVVTVYSNVGSVSQQGVISGKIPRLPGSAYAHGGIRHAADGLIVPPSNPGTLIVGEPPTGGELWMPLQGVSQGRAQGLLQSAATGYGLNVAPRPRIPAGLFDRSGGAGGAGAVRVEIAVKSDTALGSLLAKMLRSGDLQIKTSTLNNDAGWTR